MSRLLHHALNETRLRLYLMRRYAFQSVLGLGLLLGLFGGLLFAVSSVSGKNLASGALDGLLLGFVLWQFATAAYGSACSDIAEETRQRTLEGLCVAPLSLSALLGLRAGLQLLSGLLSLGLALLAVAWLTDGRVQLLAWQALLPVLLAAPALLGLGYASAGVLLLVKRAEALPALFSMALIALVALPAYPANAWALLPYAMGAAAAKAAAAGAVLGGADWALLAANGLLYLGLGWGVFRWAERRARRLGILGHG